MVEQRTQLSGCSFWLYPTHVHWQVTNLLFDIKGIGINYQLTNYQHRFIWRCIAHVFLDTFH